MTYDQMIQHVLDSAIKRYNLAWLRMQKY
jgi:hypothetical protein